MQLPARIIKAKNNPPFLILCAVFCVSLLSGCFPPPPVPYVGVSAADFTREGMNTQEIEAWEDGLRTNMQSGSFEWWYFDAEMDDGTKVVVVFYTKSMLEINQSAKPQISVEITPPGEETIAHVGFFAPETTSFSTDGFDVTMGENYGYGDLSTYIIHVQIDDVTVDLELNRTVPSWRPGNGFVYFGRNQEKYFAWLPSVPNGDINGTISYNGVERQVSGSGYHDHNWGNTAMNALFRNWWWTRGEVDGYTFISAELRTTQEHGNVKLPLFMLANNSEVIANASLPGSSMILSELNILPHPDPASPETIAHQVDIHYQRGSDQVDVSITIDELLTSANLLQITGFSPEQIEFAHKLGIDPWYSRFLTDTSLAIETDTVSYQGFGFSVLEKMDFE